MNYNGKDYKYEIKPDEGKDLIFQENIEKIALKIKINDRYEGRYELDYSVKRTDIKQLFLPNQYLLIHRQQCMRSTYISSNKIRLSNQSQI